MASGAAADKNQVVNVALRGRLNGKLITNGGTPTAEIKDPPVQQSSTGVTAEERETIGVRIQIPNAWLQAAGRTENRFDLEASVSLAPGPANLAQCEYFLLDQTTNCTTNDSYRLDGVGVWSDLAHDLHLAARVHRQQPEADEELVPGSPRTARRCCASSCRAGGRSPSGPGAARWTSPAPSS